MSRSGRSAPGGLPTEADIAAMHACIRDQLVQQLGAAGEGGAHPLWRLGQAGECGALLALPDVGGALVGGASLVAADFLAIARAAVES